MTFILFIYADYVKLVSDSYVEHFGTTGPDDPRIAEAIAKCRAAGYTINTVRI
jgi:hypothetical protein